MKLAYKHVDLDDNDEAQYCWFYPKTNRMKGCTPHAETLTIPDDQLDEFHKYWIKVDEENSAYKQVDQTSHTVNKVLIVKDDAQKLLSPLPHIELTIKTSENVMGGKKNIANFKLNVNSATHLRATLDSFIKRNT